MDLKEICQNKKYIHGGVHDMFLNQHDSGIGTKHSNNIVEHGPKSKNTVCT